RNDCTTHHLKEIRRDRGHAHLLRRAVDTRKSLAKRIDGAKVLEVVLSTIAQVKEVGIGKRKVFDVAPPHVAARQDQTVWVFVWKWPQQHAVSDAKDSRTGANGQRDGNHCRDGKYGTLAQRAKGVDQISKQHGHLTILSYLSACNGTVSKKMRPARERDSIPSRSSAKTSTTSAVKKPWSTKT